MSHFHGCLHCCAMGCCLTPIFKGLAKPTAGRGRGQGSTGIVGWVEAKRVLHAFCRNPSYHPTATPMMGFGKAREERTRFSSTHPTRARVFIPVAKWHHGTSVE